MVRRIPSHSNRVAWRIMDDPWVCSEVAFTTRVVEDVVVLRRNLERRSWRVQAILHARGARLVDGHLLHELEIRLDSHVARRPDNAQPSLSTIIAFRPAGEFHITTIAHGVLR